MLGLSIRADFVSEVDVERMISVRYKPNNIAMSDVSKECGIVGTQ